MHIYRSVPANSVENLNDLQQDSGKSHIRVFGIAEATGEKCKDLVMNVKRRNLKLDVNTPWNGQRATKPTGGLNRFADVQLHS